mmetsp:Transcript_6182/g.7087  ORF Transcript_6182/g.7087 Transcript_6182/m.7087 type:complete len:745 (+) Transcript_6182:170-2404(+)|eukprot:CAMPEP_0197844410 /NCGR_PEP_ID=MMETSP1438-20131217/1391_1 /TAXON_ID=1461541 /ORGANISM="Pterosperma sp., Strain CCMP1384" /LENGTH=744 /DNA_ID=CAMNT_0043455177 /DNA_START=165 /DNA_END=2399 /DNA_ORIENTATION=-
MGCGSSKNAGMMAHAAPPELRAQAQSLRGPDAVSENRTAQQAATSAPAPPAPAKSAGPAKLEGSEYGEYRFAGAIAEKYLSKRGLTLADYEGAAWIKDKAMADKVADSMLEWAVSKGASTFCHLFQPMGATLRHGQTGCVQLTMMRFGKDGAPFWKFDGDDLLQGETDGSSYPNGGIRATHTAGGYLTVDPESPPYIRDDVMYIPACFVSYTGYALDEKTPLKRAVQALSNEGTRLLKLMGYETSGLVVNIGLEQEFFLIPRDAYFKRPDLQMAGRTVLGKFPARGQEACDHYMAPMFSGNSPLECLKDVQQQCFKLGIPLLTRHREVAPNQYEFAPLFGAVAVQTDQNLEVMRILEETAPKYGLAALLQEKPFTGVNGNGKHNNWSIGTKDGVNLLNVGQITKASGNDMIFPVIMSAIVSGVDVYGDLMRMAIASPGNDFRLGAMEAPPSVISTYLGKQMTEYLESFRDGQFKSYQPTTTPISLGADDLPVITAPAEDRNRTSPFPYGGHRFEFRAVGSSQNVSQVNTVLATMCAKQFKLIADRIEAGEQAHAVAQSLLKKHMKAVFNGNGYDPAWPAQADDLGLAHIDSGIDSIMCLTKDKNMRMFEEMGVLEKTECAARETVMLENYVGVVEVEAGAMIDMVNQHVLPSVTKAGLGSSVEGKLKEGVQSVEAALEGIHKAGNARVQGALARTLRLETMIALREICDAAEAQVPADLWTLATMKELLFVDTNKNTFMNQYRS